MRCTSLPDMDNRTPPDECISIVLASPTAKSNLSAVYECMRSSQSSNLLLSEFDDIDKIRDIATVMNADDGTTHLVYPDDHPTHARMELMFDVAGYLISFNLPGHQVPLRCVVLRGMVVQPPSLISLSL